MVNAVIYTRVSSKNQENGMSFDVQQQLCSDFAKQNNFKVVTIVRETVSSFQLNKGRQNKLNKNKSLMERRDRQAEFWRILKSRKRGDVIIVARPDRLARHKEKLFWYIEELNKRGLILIVLRQNEEPLYSNRSDDVAILNKLVGLANLESRTISDRCSMQKLYVKGLNKTFGLNLYPGGSIPFGYKLDNVTREINGETKTFKVLTEIPMEIFTIREILKMYYENHIRDIADNLNSRFLLYRGRRWNSKYVSYIARKNLAKFRDIDDILPNFQAIKI